MFSPESGTSVPERTAAPAPGSPWQRLTASELVQIRDRHAIATLHRAARNVPFYRWFYASVGFHADKVRTPADFFAEVPFVAKSDVVRYQEATVGRLAGPDQRQLHLTSGTSGAGRELFPRTSGDVAALGVGGAYGFHWAGLRPGDRMMLTIPYSQTMAGPYFQGVCRTLGVVAINGFAFDTERRLDALAEFGCRGLVATPSHLHRLAVAAKALGLRPQVVMPELGSIILSGEPYGIAWATEMEDFWGARLFEGWGATQTLGVALATCSLGSCPRGGDGSVRRGFLHSLDHRCLVELLGTANEAVAPGEVGEAVVTTLRSFGMPSIRFRMGDMVRSAPTEGCPCGLPFGVFEAGTIGRLDDMFKVRGMNIWPSAIDDLVLGKNVEDYRGRIFTDTEGREQIEISVATAVEPGEWLENLADRIRHHIGVRVSTRHVPPGTYSDSTFKARRWEDCRAVR